MDVDGILGRALEGGGIGGDDALRLLSLEDPASVSKLFAAARELRDANFGNRVFLYGFVYFSTYCGNECAFCHYRRQHPIARYRKGREEVVALAGSLMDSDINLVDLTMGEDPAMHADGCSELIDIVSAVDSAVDIPIMVSPGVVPREAFGALAEAGADWYACYQETYNRSLFGRLRVNQGFDARVAARESAVEHGILAEDGIMAGVGDTVADRADSVMRMGAGCDQVRAMTFVPQEGTPMWESGTVGTVEELKVVAVLRLAYPDKLIPASLDVEGLGGLRPRLDAGANVVTSIVPPKAGLAGVAQKDLDIESGKRSVRAVFECLDSMGMKAASNAEYSRFVKERKASL
ncbi:MAG: methylornithine synthase PylB [Thermoplasmatales archaeon]|nr:methylornithine synthase PylB [Thermoplasmatales archaeon]